MDEVDAGGKGGEGDDKVMTAEAGLRISSGAMGGQAVPGPVAELDVFPAKLAPTHNAWESRESTVGRLQDGIKRIGHVQPMIAGLGVFGRFKAYCRSDGLESGMG